MCFGIACFRLACFRFESVVLGVSCFRIAPPASMENLEVLVRGFAISSSSPVGLGLPRSVSFQGLELLWVVVVATIVLAVVSVSRVSVVTWGWSTNKSEGGHVRVRVHGAIVTAGGMFSAEIVNCSADSCSEDASSSDECVAERAEMLFIFDQKGASLMATTTKVPAQRVAASEKITQELPEIQELLQLEAAPQACSIAFPRLEGIEWDASPANAFPSCAVGSLLPAWASPVVCRASPLASRHNSFTDWDPLLKLRIRDAVLSDGSFARNSITLPLAPVAIPGSTSGATLKDDVVRVWDCDSKTLLKSVHLSEGGYSARAPVSAFDVNWESKVAAMSKEGGVLAFANLECGVYEECYQTQQSVVQAIHLDRASSRNTVFTGGPVSANPGCSVSLWDYRSSNRELTMNLSSAIALYGISTDGQELYVRDDPGSVATHDVRMLGASPVSRMPCDIVNHATQDRWWDIDTTLVDEDDEDDDDWFDCLTSEEIQTAGASSYMGRNFVKTLSRNFSTKA